jgi:hypothetical protein
VVTRAGDPGTTQSACRLTSPAAQVSSMQGMFSMVGWLVGCGIECRPSLMASRNEPACLCSAFRVVHTAGNELGQKKGHA